MLFSTFFESENVTHTFNRFTIFKSFEKDFSMAMFFVLAAIASSPIRRKERALRRTSQFIFEYRLFHVTYSSALLELRHFKCQVIDLNL